MKYAENLPIEVKFSDGTPRTAFPTDTIYLPDKLKFETFSKKLGTGDPVPFSY